MVCDLTKNIDIKENHCHDNMNYNRNIILNLKCNINKIFCVDIQKPQYLTLNMFFFTCAV